MKIVNIPPKMEKFYGSGHMLHPDIDGVENLLQKIPYGKIVLINSFCDQMAYESGVDVSCPMRTSSAIKKITESANFNENKNEVPFWRVIRKNHLLINSSFTEACAEMLISEGFQVEQKKGGEWKVVDFAKQLFVFDKT